MFLSFCSVTSFVLFLLIMLHLKYLDAVFVIFVREVLLLNFSSSLSCRRSFSFPGARLIFLYFAKRDLIASSPSILSSRESSNGNSWCFFCFVWRQHKTRRDTHDSDKKERLPSLYCHLSNYIVIVVCSLGCSDSLSSFCRPSSSFCDIEDFLVLWWRRLWTKQWLLR